MFTRRGLGRGRIEGANIEGDVWVYSREWFRFYARRGRHGQISIKGAVQGRCLQGDVIKGDVYKGDKEILTPNSI